MPQQVRISRKLQFVGAADKGDNVYGDISYNKVVFYDDFLGDVIADQYAVNTENGTSGAIAAGIGGILALASNTASNNKVEVATELNWEAAKACIMETRLSCDDVANVAILVGFNDLAAEVAQNVAFSISNVTITNNTSDAVMFVFDSDQAVDNWYYCNDKNNTAAGTLSDVALANTTWYVLRIETDTDGNAWFYIDGDIVGYKANAITNTDDLTPYLAVSGRNSDIATVSVDYLKCWQNRE